MKVKPEFHHNTPDEEAEIQRGIDSDPDTVELTDEQMARMIPHADFMAKRGRGRPRLDEPKLQVSLRLDVKVVEGYRATGNGWQTRINEVLLRGLKTMHAKQRTK